MNIYDISKKAGVSIATVSRVINGAENVSDKTREKILRIMEESDYMPNAFARGLGRGTMETIGIMCSDASDIYLANAIYFLETALRSHGYDSILCCTGYSLENKQKSFELLRSKKVDAVILVGSKFVEMEPENNNYIIEGAKEQPVMLVNGYLEGDNIYSTLCDDAGGMCEAVIRLVNSGCRNIVYVYSSVSHSGLEKLEGVKRGFKRCGIPFDPKMVVQCKKDFYEAADVLDKMYDAHPFDAVLTSSDNSGIGALKFAVRKGLSVPDDLSIISFNNSILARSANPELTSVDSKIRELCDTTVTSLMKLLNPLPGPDGSIEPPRVPHKIVIKTNLIERGTTRLLKPAAS